MIFSCFLYIVEEIGVLRWYITEDTVKKKILIWIFIIIYRFPRFLP